MEYKRYIINNQKDIYKFKLEFLSFGLKFNSKKQFYYNPSELDFQSEEYLKRILDENKYEYSMKDEKELDFFQKIGFIYKLTSIDTNSFLISKRRNNEHLYFVNYYSPSSYLNITDLSEGKFLSKKISITDSFDFYLPIITLQFLNSTVNDFNFLIQILSVLVDVDKQELNFQNRLNAFKYHVFSIIKEKNQDNFLCNCVDGFYAETNFYVKGDKIYSDYLESFVSSSQEQKILKYLYNNRKHIGVKKEPTYKDMFLRKKIIIKDKEGIEFKCLINKVICDKSTDLLLVSVFDGNKTYPLSKQFRKEELFELIKYTRSA
jgi:hypothetical protein